MIDIVVPKGNENDLIAMAQKLGYDALCLLYDTSKDIAAIRASTPLRLYTAVRKQGQRADLRISIGRQGLRETLEQRRADACFDIELDDANDYMHSRNSGLNQVLAQLFFDKDVLLGWSLATLLGVDDKVRTISIGRMQQNVVVARKYKLKTTFASFASSPLDLRNPKDMMAFLRVMGMTGAEVNGALDALEAKIKHNQEKRSPSYIAEGVRIVG